MQDLTGIDNPRSVQQVTTWLEEETGEEVDNLRKGTVAERLAGDDLTADARRVLEIRQKLGKTSLKKYDAMLQVAGADDRLRGLFKFYGANRTGRWAGRHVQPQNLPRNSLETLDIARQYAKSGNTEAIRILYGDVPDTLSQLIRTAFIPEDGNTF